MGINAVAPPNNQDMSLLLQGLALATTVYGQKLNRDQAKEIADMNDQTKRESEAALRAENATKITNEQNQRIIDAHRNNIVVPAGTAGSYTADSLFGGIPGSGEAHGFAPGTNLLPRESYEKNLDRQNAFKIAGIKEKTDNIAQKITVPGFERTGEVLPSPEEAKDARDAVATYNSVDKNIDELKKLINKNGAFQKFGPDASRMSSLAADLRVQAKSLEKLGALSGSDYALLDAQLQDPGSLTAFFSKKESANAQADQFRINAANKLQNKLTSMGYVPNTETAMRFKNLPNGSQSDSENSAMGGDKFMPSLDAIDAEIARRKLGK